MREEVRHYPFPALRAALRSSVDDLERLEAAPVQPSRTAADLRRRLGRALPAARGPAAALVEEICGEWVKAPRPVRPPAMLAKNPASTERYVRGGPCEAIRGARAA